MADGRAEIDAAITRYLEKVAVAIEADAKAGCPRDTGRLAESIHHEIADGGKTARIGTNVDYALPTEFGSMPHIIRGNPWLAFYWEKMGADFVGREVHHPGTPEQPFLRPALFRQRGAL
jgi:phage gpG-like protein